jgi:hypothetical protein
MRFLKVNYLPFVLLWITSLACGAIGGDPPPTQDTVATIVAATLAMSESQETEDPTAAPPVEEPTLTTTPEITLTPTLLPPALKVVYTNNGNAWIWAEGSGYTQLTTDGGVLDVNISDDGQVVAYTRRGSDDYHAELWAINADGTNPRNLVSQADFDAMPRGEDYYITFRPLYFDWVPDSHTLAFNTNPVWDGPGFFPTNDLHLVDVDSRVYTPWLEAGMGGNFFYSPDGAQIALVTPESLSLINADGSNRRDLLTFPFIYTYSEWQYYPEPVWAADSSALRVAIPPQDPMGNPEAFTFIWHIPADGSLPYMAAEVVTAPAFLESPRISSDLEKLLYLFPAGETYENLELHWTDLNTLGEITYTSGNLRISGWTPDSSRFVYASVDGTHPQLGEIGLAPFALTDQPAARNITWIDDTRFLFLSGFMGARELRVGTPGGPSDLIATLPDDFVGYDFTQ